MAIKNATAPKVNDVSDNYCHEHFFRSNMYGNRLSFGRSEKFSYLCNGYSESYTLDIHKRFYRFWTGKILPQHFFRTGPKVVITPAISAGAITMLSFECCGRYSARVMGACFFYALSSPRVQ